MMSAMIWFRADPANDAAVSAALRQTAASLAAEAPVRFGHRHEEDRPYRTWMLDAGPVPPERYDALLFRLHRLLAGEAFRALAQGETHLESFAWQHREGIDRCA
jgi:hypothetical protein